MSKGKEEPILKANLLSDEVDKIAKETKRPDLADSAFARLLKVSTLASYLHVISCKETETVRTTTLNGKMQSYFAWSSQSLTYIK